MSWVAISTIFPKVLVNVSPPLLSYGLQANVIYFQKSDAARHILPIP